MCQRRQKLLFCKSIHSGESGVSIDLEKQVGPEFVDSLGRLVKRRPLRWVFASHNKPARNLPRSCIRFHEVAEPVRESALCRLAI